MENNQYKNTFSMPMFRNFVPTKVRPWLYLFLAFTFQLSGGLYLGALHEMIGEMSLMREDVLMCLYANLAGMAVYFPLLFRMKFRFTNKTLLIISAGGVLLCNLAAPYVTFLPLLWILCFIEGICKLQGTFECISNIQLWLTPKRDFTVFFPLLNLLILGCMQVSDILMTYLMYHFHWIYMHLFVAGFMVVDLLFLTVSIHHFSGMKKVPLYGIDWVGALLWSSLLLQIAYLCNYGEWYRWWDNPIFYKLSVCIIATLFVCIWRMATVRRPYLSPHLFTSRRLLLLFGLVTLVEAVFITQYVLEKIFFTEVTHYAAIVSVRFSWLSLLGVLWGCSFSYWWMHIKHFTYIRLVIIGIIGLICYQIGVYLTISSNIHISQFYIPILCRSFSYAMLCCAFFVYLKQIVAFPLFFQALSVFNMLHMIIGGVIGAAIYTRGLSYYIADNMARYGTTIDNVSFSRSPFNIRLYMDTFVPHILEISVKQLYGWTVYICVFLFLALLIYNMPLWRK